MEQKPTSLSEHTIQGFIELKPISDVSDRYIEWLNDPAINRYLETKFDTQDRASVEGFVRQVNASKDSHLFGIFLNDSHIGNIKVGPINRFHEVADVSLLIGERAEWGKGHARTAISLITGYAFQTLKLHKTMAGMYEGNTASHRAFLKCGYIDAGRWLKHRKLDGQWVDQIWVEKSNPSH